jgi:hypothetical protein
VSLSNLQQIVNESASKKIYNPNEDHTEAEAQLRGLSKGTQVPKT